MVNRSAMSEIIYERQSVTVKTFEVMEQAAWDKIINSGNTVCKDVGDTFLIPQ